MLIRVCYPWIGGRASLCKGCDVIRVCCVNAVCVGEARLNGLQYYATRKHSLNKSLLIKPEV